MLKIREYLPQAFVLMFLIATDVVTGLIAALYKGDYNSSVMREGAYHKLCEILVFVLSKLADIYLPVVGINMTVQCAPLVTLYFAVMECCSIIENIGKISPSAVRPLQKFFAKLKDEVDK